MPHLHPTPREVNRREHELSSLPRTNVDFPALTSDLSTYNDGTMGRGGGGGGGVNAYGTSSVMCHHPRRAGAAR